MRFRYSGSGSARGKNDFPVAGFSLDGKPYTHTRWERWYMPVSNLPADADLNYSVYDHRYGTGTAAWYVIQVKSEGREHTLEFERDKTSERKFGECKIIRSNVNIGYVLTLPDDATLYEPGVYMKYATTPKMYDKWEPLFCNEWLRDYLNSIDISMYKPWYYEPKTGSGGLITQPTHVYRNGGASYVQKDLYVNYMTQLLAAIPDRYHSITEGKLRFDIFSGNNAVLYNDLYVDIVNEIDGIPHVITGEPVKKGISGVQIINGQVSNEAYYGTYNPHIYTVNHEITTRDGGFFDNRPYKKSFYIDADTNLMEIMNDYITEKGLGPYINKGEYKFCVYPGTVTLNAHNYKTDTDETIEYVPVGYFFEVISLYSN